MSLQYRAMAIKNFAALLHGKRQRWYETERNTAKLVGAVVAARGWKTLTGQQMWHLLRLTWITKGPQHWQKLKIPALAKLFTQPVPKASELPAAIAVLDLPQPILAAGLQKTGFVNFRNVWRNSSKTWCVVHIDKLRKIVGAAVNLGPNDQARFDLAKAIERLPPIPAPSRGST